MTLEEAKKEIERHEAVYREADEDTYCRGVAGGLREALIVLDEIEHVGNPDKLTLTELAHELRKIFRFKYLTACNKMTGSSPIGLDLSTGYRPWFSSDGYWSISYVVGGGSLVIPVALLSMDLDLSEYADEDGNIDYSKCIVEVE